MSVLVTAGAGYIGSQKVLELTDAGETVVVLDNLSTGFEAAVPPSAKLVVGDVGNPTLLASVITEHKIDAIIHFAGSVVVPESVANPPAGIPYRSGNASCWASAYAKRYRIRPQPQGISIFASANIRHANVLSGGDDYCP